MLGKELKPMGFLNLFKHDSHQRFLVWMMRWILYYALG